MRTLDQAKLDAIDSPLFLGDTTYDSLLCRYADSPEGLLHSQQELRFGLYSYDRLQKLSDIGNSVHPIRHMTDITENIVRPMLRRQVLAGKAGDLTVENCRAIILTGKLHDIGESVVGDISATQKTDADEQAEAIARVSIRDRFFNDIPDLYIESMEAIIYKGTLPSSVQTMQPAKELFRCAEDLDYYKTGIIAGAKALNFTSQYEDGSYLHSDRLFKLGLLAIDIPKYWYEALADRAKQYPLVSNVLINSSVVHRLVNARIAPNFGPKSPQENLSTQYGN